MIRYLVVYLYFMLDYNYQESYWNAVREREHYLIIIGMIRNQNERS